MKLVAADVQRLAGGLRHKSPNVVRHAALWLDVEQLRGADTGDLGAHWVW
jgi:hypothetical protein